MIVKLHRRGKRSLGLAIPAKIVESLSINPGMRVGVECHEDFVDIFTSECGRKLHVIGWCDHEGKRSVTLGFTIPKKELNKYGYQPGEVFYPKIIEVVDGHFRIRFYRGGKKRSGSHTQSAHSVQY